MKHRYLLKKNALIAALLTVFTAAAVAVPAAHADATDPGMDKGTAVFLAARSSLGYPAKFVWGFETGGWRTIAMKILDLMVQEGMTNLQSVGEIDLSQQLQKEWQVVYPQALANVQQVEQDEQLGILDLGDHDPLLPWLAKYVDILNQKTHGIAGKIQLVQDITTLNYAIPIVFHPSGDWKTSYGDKAWVEYRLHFIPFANVLTYWGALEGCKYAAAKSGYSSLSNFCDPISNKLEFLMGRYLAPRISDYVFVDANPGTVINDGGPTKPKPGEQDFRLPTASGLAGSIQSDNGGAQ